MNLYILLLFSLHSSDVMASNAAAAAAIRWSMPITPAQVERLMRAERDAHKALLIFDAATAEYSSGYRHDLSTFSLISSRLAAAGLPRAAELILIRALSELRRPLQEQSFIPVLRSYGRTAKPLEALRLLREMRHCFAINLSSRPYTAVLAALVSNSHFKLAKDLYNEMRVLGFQPTVSSCNVLIKGLCSSGDVDSALNVFDKMASLGCAPDVCTYNTVIDGLCKAGRVCYARQMFDEMWEKGCSPTVITYTSMIDGLCKSSNIDDALEMFDEMGSKGVAPNVVTYSSLVDGLCKGGRVVKATELLERMASERCPPNLITYSSVIDGLCQDRKLKKALEVFDRMRLQGKKPDAGLYGKIIKGLCDSESFAEAANYLDEMALSGISPNRVTWSVHINIHNMVVRGLCSKNNIKRALQVFRSMSTRSIITEVETYCSLVHSLCSKGDLQKASEIISDMLFEGCAPDERTWYAIVGTYWVHNKAKDSAERLLISLMKDATLASKANS